MNFRVFKNIIYFLNWYLNKKKLEKIKLIVSDVDGVLTDGGIYISNSGEQVRKFNVKDGLGVKLLQEEGIDVALISGGNGASIVERAKALNIKYCFTGIKDKGEVIKELQEKLGILIKETAFIGDDLNDIPTKPFVSLLISPANAISEFKKVSDCSLLKKGGDGAFREFSDKVLQSKKNWFEIKKRGWIENN